MNFVLRECALLVT